MSTGTITGAGSHRDGGYGENDEQKTRVTYPSVSGQGVVIYACHHCISSRHAIKTPVRRMFDADALGRSNTLQLAAPVRSTNAKGLFPTLRGERRTDPARALLRLEQGDGTTWVFFREG